MGVYIEPEGEAQREISLEEANVRLSRGELTGATPAWTDGLEGWVPLREIPGIILPAGDSLFGPPVRDVPTIGFFGGNTHPWRRFFARNIDQLVLGIPAYVMFVFMAAIVLQIAAPGWIESFTALMGNTGVVAVTVMLMMIPVEALFLRIAGATPAKWLFGIRVATAEGRHLTLARALQRSILIFFLGEGIGIPLFALFFCLFGYRRLTRTGSTVWDNAAGSIVMHRRWGPVRTVVCTLVVMGLMILSAAVVLNRPWGKE